MFRLISKGLYFITRNPRFLLGSMYKLTNAQVTVIKKKKKIISLLNIYLKNPTIFQIAPRLLWVLNHNHQVADDLRKDCVAFGTLDSWLLYRFSGKRLHVTDMSSASATGLFDPFLLTWSPWPFKLFGIPMNIFPDIVDSAGFHFGYTDLSVFGESIPICCSVSFTFIYCIYFLMIVLCYFYLLVLDNE